MCCDIYQLLLSVSSHPQDHIKQFKHNHNLVRLLNQPISQSLHKIKLQNHHAGGYMSKIFSRSHPCVLRCLCSICKQPVEGDSCSRQSVTPVTSDSIMFQLPLILFVYSHTLKPHSANLFAALHNIGYIVAVTRLILVASVNPTFSGE